MESSPQVKSSITPGAANSKHGPQKLNLHQQTKLTYVFPIDFRPKLELSMLDGTVVFSRCLCTAGELLNGPISSIAERINKAVERVNEDHGWSRINHMDMDGFEEFALSTLHIS
ncbi:hypothetical protein NL676_027537 [Syzygium grande]|nr:hypothetical protein NL676_027537 [Syzygium grande]